IDDLSLAAVDAACRPRPTEQSCPPQVRDEFLLQRPSRLDEQGQVDRLVRHPHSLVVGKLDLQPAGNLRRRPVFPQLRGDDPAQSRPAGQFAALRSPRTLPGAPIGLGGAVTAWAPMAIELTCDRRGRSAQTGGNPSRRLASGNAARDLLPLLKRQRQAASAPLGGSDASTQPDRATNSSGRPLERPADLADRLASLPALPQLPTLLRRVLPPPPRQRTPPAREPKRCCADGLTARTAFSNSHLSAWCGELRRPGSSRSRGREWGGRARSRSPLLRARSPNPGLP